MKGIKNFLACADLHYPLFARDAWGAFLNFLSFFKPKVFVFGGDQLDLSLVSHFDKSKIRKTEGHRLFREYDGFDLEILQPLESRLPKDCKKIWINGNHEDWIEQWLDENPVFEGGVEPENYLRLNGRGWEIFPYGSRNAEKTVYWLTPKLCIAHGFYCNVYHSRKHVEAVGKSIIYFHTHTFQSFTKENIVENKDHHTAYAIGCMCKTDPSYGKGRPNRWLQGFCYGYLLENGNFNVYPTVIIKGKFVALGKVFKP